MAQDTGIEWVVDSRGERGETANPTAGCKKASRGCWNCYAERLHDQRHTAWLAGRGDAMPVQYRQPFHVLQLFPDRLRRIYSRQRPGAFFVGSMSDLCLEEFGDAGRDVVWATLGCLLCRPDHIGFLLTKHPDVLLRYLLDAQQEVSGAHACLDAAMRVVPGFAEWTNRRQVTVEYANRMLCWPPPNVWFGFSAEDQPTYDLRARYALAVPAATSSRGLPQRFLSAEPLVGPLLLHPHDAERLGGVIGGGENGPHAAPTYPDFPRQLVWQCRQLGIPVSWKQWGEWVPAGQSILPRPSGTPECFFNDGTASYRVGRQAAGRKLDGEDVWDLPWVDPVA